MLLTFALAVSLLLQKSAIAVQAPQQIAPEPYVAPYTAMSEHPETPKVDLNACPFEGCQFGKWTARDKVVVYSTWEPARRPIATLTQGDQVAALTGVNIVLQPGKGVFDRDVPLYGAQRGDTAYTYRECGEGAVDIWVHGRFIPCADLEFSWQPGYGCQNNCDGRWLSLGKSEWWAQIRMKNGITGWVLVEDNFDGIDAIG